MNHLYQLIHPLSAANPESSWHKLITTRIIGIYSWEVRAISPMVFNYALITRPIWL